jgi:hypothetical protein
MAVYVKGGRVIAVREFVGVSPRQLDELTKYVEAIVSATAPDDVVNGFRGQVAGLRKKPDELAAFLLGGLNTFVVSAGREAIHFRTMSIELEDLGAVDEQISLPADGIKGNLAVLQNLGRKPVSGATDQGARPAVPQPPATDASTEPTTTTAGA